MSEATTAGLDLGPTQNQLLHSFGWAALGLAIGVFFAGSTLFGEPQRETVIIGVVIIVLALASAVLEYLALPGAMLVFGTEHLVVTPRRGPSERFSYAHIGYLSLVPGPHTREGRVRTARNPGGTDMDPEVAPVTHRRPLFGRDRALKRPHWYLEVSVNREGRVAGRTSLNVAVGGNRARRDQLRRLGLTHGVAVSDGQ